MREREGGGGGRERGGERERREKSLFKRVIDKHVCFFTSVLAQTRDHPRSNYTCTHFLIYDTPVHTQNKRSPERERERKRRTRTTGTRRIGRRRRGRQAGRRAGRQTQADRTADSPTKRGRMKERQLASQINSSDMRKVWVCWRGGGVGGGGGTCFKGLDPSKSSLQ